MTRVLRQILDANGVIIQVQEDIIPDVQVQTDPTIVAIQAAPFPAIPNDSDTLVVDQQQQAGDNPPS